MGYKLSTETEIHLLQCCQCGVQFGLTQRHYLTLTESKENFYCPNGHVQAFTSSPLLREKEAAEQEVERQKRLVQWGVNQRGALQRELALAQRQLNACKGQVTKIKNKTAAKGA